jgi:hypothetical protein
MGGDGLVDRLVLLGMLAGMNAIIPAAVQTSVSSVVQSGVGLGAVLAVVCSWERNRSVLLAAVAGLFNWFYVIYFVLTRRPGETRRES